MLSRSRYRPNLSSDSRLTSRRRMRHLNNRMDSHNNRMDSHNNRMHSHNRRMHSHNRCMDSLFTHSLHPCMHSRGRNRLPVPTAVTD